MPPFCPEDGDELPGELPVVMVEGTPALSEFSGNSCFLISSIEFRSSSFILLYSCSILMKT